MRRPMYKGPSCVDLKFEGCVAVETGSYAGESLFSIY